MKETLDKILQVETESEEIKRASGINAVKIKDEAINTGRDLVREKKRDANIKANEIIVKANKNAEEQIAGVRQEIAIEHKSLTVVAERNKTKAAEFIVERITNDI